MRRIGRRPGWWAAALVLMLLAGLFEAGGLLRPLDMAVIDARARLLQRQVSSQIVIVGIDDASVDALGDRPLPRRYHAALLEELGHAQPAAVFLDINLSTHSGSPEDDDLLESALAKRRDFRLYLPVIVTPSAHREARPTVVRPLPRFARSADLVAVDGPSPDGSPTRHWWTYRILGGERMASVIDPQRSFAEPRNVPIDFTISPESFAHVSFADVLAGRVPLATFAGKQVFVGGTLANSQEFLDVPMHGRLPRSVVQALAAETVNVGVPRPLPMWGTILVLTAVTLLAAMLFRSAWRRNLAVLGPLVAVLVSISAWAWISQRTVMPLVGPLLLLALLCILSSMRWVERRLGRTLAMTLNLRRQDGLLKSLVQASTDSILCVDDNGIVRLANPAAARLFGCAAYDLLDEPIARFITLLAGDGSGARLAALHGEIRECDARTLGGEVFPVEISVSRVRVDGLRLYTTIVRDIRERRAQHRRLEHEATHDSLTSLPNRAALLAHLERALAPDRSQPSIALLMLDLCRFKEVNDTLGHNVGDRVLCEVAQRFRQALGDRGFIARIGGDEFTVVVNRPHSSETVASTSLALADSLRSPIDVAGISIEVGVSIGIARFPQDASEAQTLLRHADVAMYVAKRRGATYEFYDSAVDENSVRKLAIGGELRSAIAGDQLELHFQPQVNLRTGMVDSVEALVRWFHPTQGAIAPAEFIAIAESTDLIRHLTEWTLRTALAQVRAWRGRGVHVRIAVNISSRLLQDTGFPVQLASLLKESGVAAASLELEITESAMMLDPARALRVIQEIHALGVLISIDDFGTGYSSLSYLRDLPVHALKLDRSFVAGMSSNADDRIIVESTAQMAHAMRLELVAEGVESEWDAQFLSAAGYDYAQGFRYTGALPAEQCLAWIAEFNATAIVAAGDTTITTALRAQAAHREIQLREPLKRAR